MKNYLKKPITSFEILNITISIIILLILMFNFSNNLIYGAVSLIAAMFISILLLRITPINFSKLSINTIQYHIFVSIVLGTILNFYTIFKNFDFFLHFCFGFIIPLVSLDILKYFYEKLNINLNPYILTTFIIFCFSLSTGVLWEIYEFSLDTFFNFNTQNNDLFDTMMDLISHTISTTIFSAIFLIRNLKTNCK